MHRGLLGGEPYRCVVLPRDDHVDVVPAGEAMRRYRVASIKVVYESDLISGTGVS
ncbi:hypothetical protein MAUB_08720 [Mycolicibacterium aubagnense]|uniref:Uncharacterized protein n=1 Tax=Mycolicibacterium aubagnense TaxID=319707 RepID=A0ABN5YRY6_9MYCO|nr:hypothetical protein MAUB_08720 [Mycolicibacterium aubagnense]